MSEIEDWVKEQLDAGYTPEEVKKSLADSGHDPDLVEGVLDERNEGKLLKRLKNPKILGLIILLVVLGIETFIAGEVINAMSFGEGGGGVGLGSTPSTFTPPQLEKLYNFILPAQVFFAFLIFASIWLNRISGKKSGILYFAGGLIIPIYLLLVIYLSVQGGSIIGLSIKNAVNLYSHIVLPISNLVIASIPVVINKWMA